MSSRQNLEIMREILAPLAEGEARPFLRALADDIVWNLAGAFPWAGSYRGKETLRTQLFGAVLGRLKQPYRLALKHLSGEGEFVTAVLHGVGNAALDGTPYLQQYCWVCRMADGKLQEVTEFADTHLVMNVVGPPPA
jgi:ketosteroid isomerase-like protein